MAELPKGFSPGPAEEPDRKHVTDEEIVIGLRAGSIVGLGNAYDKYAEVVYGIAYSLLREPADAEDLVHEVFVGLQRAIKTYEGRGSFEGWLKRVATRTGLMVLRQRRLRQDSLVKNAELLNRQHPLPIADHMDLDEALRRLSPQHRAVFVLKEIHGYPHEDIATMEGISVSAAKVRLHRARRELRHMLGKD